MPSSGVAFNTIKHRLGLKHTAANAATPNGTGIIWTSVQQWDTRNRIDVELDVADIKPDLFSKLDEFTTLQNTKNVQPLVIGSESWNAVFEGVYLTLKAPPRNQAPALEQLRDLGKQGQPIDMGVIARFREVPGTTAA